MGLEDTINSLKNTLYDNLALGIYSFLHSGLQDYITGISLQDIIKIRASYAFLALPLGIAYTSYMNSILKKMEENKLPVWQQSAYSAVSTYLFWVIPNAVVLHLNGQDGSTILNSSLVMIPSTLVYGPMSVLILKGVHSLRNKPSSKNKQAGQG